MVLFPKDNEPQPAEKGGGWKVYPRRGRKPAHFHKSTWLGRIPIGQEEWATICGYGNRYDLYPPIAIEAGWAFFFVDLFKERGGWTSLKCESTNSTSHNVLVFFPCWYLASRCGSILIYSRHQGAWQDESTRQRDEICIIHIFGIVCALCVCMSKWVRVARVCHRLGVGGMVVSYGWLGEENTWLVIALFMTAECCCGGEFWGHRQVN